MFRRSSALSAKNITTIEEASMDLYTGLNTKFRAKNNPKNKGMEKLKS
jgi:hypothetical protein